MKRRIADWFRKLANWLDFDGAPHQMSWSFTQEDGWGTVWNTEGRGCPVYYTRAADYQRSFAQAGRYGEPEDIEWVTIGTRTPDGGVHVLGSAEVKNGSTSRRTEDHAEIPVPVPLSRFDPPKLRMARVPNWIITLKCEMHSFVSLPGKTYPEAVQRMFGRAGIRG